jgi:MFS transporter, DHA2 family, multidrug resistance protein
MASCEPTGTTVDARAIDPGPTESAPARARRRQWAGLAVLALPCLVVSMDATLLHLALPQIATDLRVDGAQLLWIVDIYVFLGAGSLLTMGMVGDRLGRRRLLLVGAAAFAGASVLAACATSAALLLVARGLLGVAGATLMPSTLALIRSMFQDPVQRRQALGAWTASFAVGGLAGPVVGGLVLTYLPWSTVFLVAVPPMMLLLAVGRSVLPESRDPGPSRVDAVSAGASLAAVLSAVLGVKALAAGDAGPLPWIAVAASLGLGTAFVRRQRRQEAPVLDPGLIGRADVAAPLAVNALAFFVLYGTQYLTAQYVQLVLGLSPLAAGLWGLPGTVAFLIGSAAGPLATRRIPPATVVVAGLVVAATGFALLMLVGTGAGLAAVVVGGVVSGFGLAPVYALSTEMVVTHAPSHRAGTVSAVQETGAELGGALGVALLGSVSLVLYRTDVAAGVASTPEAVRADPGGTLAGHLAAAEELAGRGAALADVARGAFTQSYVVAEGLGAAVLAAATVGFAVVLRRSPRTSPRPQAAERSGMPTGHDDRPARPLTAAGDRRRADADQP